MEGWLAVPLIRYAGCLLLAAVVFPLLAGIIGRALFFRMDEDDVRASPHSAAELLKRKSEPPTGPEPEFERPQPWPQFPPSVLPGGPSRQ